MIINYTISKEGNLGVYQIVVNLAEKWVDYMVNRVFDSKYPNRITITFFSGENDEFTKYIQMPEGFEPFHYLITSMQEKDQIIIIAVPKKALIDRNLFKII